MWRRGKCLRHVRPRKIAGDSVLFIDGPLLSLEIVNKGWALLLSLIVETLSLKRVFPPYRCQANPKQNSQMNEDPGKHPHGKVLLFSNDDKSSSAPHPKLPNCPIESFNSGGCIVSFLVKVQLANEGSWVSQVC